jgi:protein-disulfide isomerase
MSQEKSTEGGSSRGVAILGMVVTFLGGYVLGSMSTGKGKAAKDPAKVSRKAVVVGESPVKGPDDALVTIIEFADFQCGYCRRSVPHQRRLEREYGGRVRWVFKHLPLGFHRRARPAAAAAMAAGAQGKFWEYHDRLFLQQDKMSDEDFIAHAAALDLDVEQFRKDLLEKKFDAAIQADMDTAKRFKVEGTPNFFINGRHIMGSLSYSRLDEIVREEMAYAKGLMARGVKRVDLYNEMTKGGSSGQKTDEPKTDQPKDERKHEHKADEQKQPTARLAPPAATLAGS